MTSSQFITLLSRTYNEPMVVDGEQNLKLKFIKKWLDDDFAGKDLNPIAELVIKNFVPTSVNPCPLIPHIRAIINQDKDTDIDIAKEIADKIINAVGKFGYTMPKSAEEYVGDIGWQVVERYGGWTRFSQELITDQLEIVRAHLRDSSLTLIRKNKNKEKIDKAINFVKIKSIEGC
jgi:hypothetical protein